MRCEQLLKEAIGLFMDRSSNVPALVGAGLTDNNLNPSNIEIDLLLLRKASITIANFWPFVCSLFVDLGHADLLPK